MPETIFGTLSVRSSKARNAQKTGLISLPRPYPIKDQPIKAARMLALAHHLVRALDVGVDPRKLAKELGLRSETRVTQLAELAFLAPDIQEEILGMTRKKGGRVITEHDLRKVCRAKIWEEQRMNWRRLKNPENCS